MDTNVQRLERLYQENITSFKAMLDSNALWGLKINVLANIKNIIVGAGIDEFIYKGMENDILKGNFSVIYLDDRVVGDDKKRIEAKTQLEKLRSTLFKMKNEGTPIFSILFES